MHRAVILGILALTIGAGVAVTVPIVADGDAGTDSILADPPPLGLEHCATDPPPDGADPDEDVLGWYGGYWYSDSLDHVSHEDGITAEELESIVNRSKARWEALRCLPFEDDVPVRVIDRDTYRDNYTGGQRGENATKVHNAQAQALFMVNQSADSVAVEEANRGESVGGFYDTTDNEIVLVSGDDGKIFVDEVVLAHELGHALQDQHFDLVLSGNTTDQRQANLGLIEGEAVFGDTVYRGHCEAGAWAGDCFEPPTQSPRGELASVGLFLISFQPYADGPNFVNERYQAGGWEAVNDLYEAYPTSAKEIMYPERYGEFTPTDPGLEDRSTDQWQRIDLRDGHTGDRLGEPVWFAAFAAPTIESGSSVSPIIPQDDIFNIDPATGELDPLDPYNYRHEITEGWIGDRFKTFAEADAEDPALAFSTKIAFEDSAGAEAFLDGYEHLLSQHGAEEATVNASQDATVYTIDPDDDFGGAYWVEHRDATVHIVHAPDLDSLTAVDTSLTLGEQPSVEDNTLAIVVGIGVVVGIGFLVVMFLRRR